MVQRAFASHGRCLSVTQRENASHDRCLSLTQQVFAPHGRCLSATKTGACFHDRICVCIVLHVFVRIQYQVCHCATAGVTSTGV